MLASRSTMRNIFTMVLIGACVLSFTRPGFRAQETNPPNIVVIMTDDLSVDALNALLAAGLMPNLQERLIDQGISFENAFVTDAICCPSRTTFLRGQYAHNHGVLSNVSSRIPQLGITWPGWFPEGGNPGKNESTIATWLQGGGYTTGFVGKYLNGYGVSAPEGVADPLTYIPPGWDDWQGLIDPTTYQVYDYQINDNGNVITYGNSAADYQTDVLAERAAGFIQSRAVAGETFFLAVMPLAPHTEIIDPDHSGYVHDSFADTIRPAPRHDIFLNGDPADGEVPALVQKPSFNEADVTDKPSCPRPDPPDGLVFVTDPLCVADRPPLAADPDVINLEGQYGSMLASLLSVDDLLGEVLDSLEVNGLLDQTVVVFTSDNGMMYGEHRLGGKQVPYEESIRVPLVVRAPGIVAGAVASQIVLNNDLAPTLAHMAGVALPYDPDGTSMVPLLLNPGRTDWHRRSFLIEHWFVPSFFLKFENPSYAAVRSIKGNANFLYVNWRADVQNPGAVTHREFYDLSSDIYQLQSASPPTGMTNALDQFVAAFRQCAGQNCRHLESF